MYAHKHASVVAFGGMWWYAVVCGGYLCDSLLSLLFYRSTLFQVRATSRCNDTNTIPYAPPPIGRATTTNNTANNALVLVREDEGCAVRRECTRGPRHACGCGGGCGGGGGGAAAAAAVAGGMVVWCGACDAMRWVWWALAPHSLAVLTHSLTYP